MRIAVVCWRPYQVFNTIRIITSHIIEGDNQYDLYIQDLPSLLSIRKNLLDICLFEHIYVFEEKTQGNSTRIRIKRIINYLQCENALIDDDLTGVAHSYTGYNIIMASGWASYFVELVNANPKAAVYMFEDGTATYYLGDERPYMPKTHLLFYKAINLFFKKGPFSVHVNRIYVNSYGFCVSKFKYNVFQIPPLTDEQLKLLRIIFGHIDYSLYNGKKFIYLSQYPDDVMCQALNDFKDTTIVRPHPKFPFNPSGFVVDNSGAMWELVINGLAEDTTLISTNSTAMFTPQLIYNKKFTLIFLYRITCKESSVVSEFDRIIKIFQQDNQNIYTPATYDEYIQLLHTLSF